MQNRKLQGEDIEKLKKENNNTSSKTQAGAQSVTGTGNDSGSPLVHAANDVVGTDWLFLSKARFLLFWLISLSNIVERQEL